MHSLPPADGLYVLSLSVHGLVRGRDIELGRDADTGGQVLYVVDQARALARHAGVGRVTLATRRIFDRRVDPAYAKPLEELGNEVRIRRIAFGPRRYLRKESFWPYLDSMVDQILRHIRSRALVPDVIHGHYADGGYVGAQLARVLGVPFVFTGHSLGRIKHVRLLEKNTDPEVLERQFHFRERIEAEEMALEAASLVITSTTQEVEEQYQLYDHYQPERMEVIPPGVDLDRFHPHERGEPEPPIATELARFLRDPKKPILLAMARPDEKKNFPTLIRAFARTPGLRERANLVLVAGNRDDLHKLEPAPRRVLGQIIALIDRYDLYGSVAYPKGHTPEDVPDLYRLAARRRGLFVNVAVTEPFGLTLIEAAASGLPIVATRDGGPRDIVRTCRNGVLVDPLDVEAVGAAITESLDDPRRWRRRARRGIDKARQVYTWESHVNRYYAEVTRILTGTRPGGEHLPARRSRLPGIDRILVTDVDNTLTGDDEALAALVRRIEENDTGLGLAIATGRTPDRALEVLEELGYPTPDIVIACVGTEVYYGELLALDRSWQRHINWQWNPVAVRDAVAELPGLELQEPPEQRAFKVSYVIDTRSAPGVREIRRHLRQAGIRARLVGSLGQYLDVTPIRASAGAALRFLSIKWDLAPERFLVAGDSGNDADMLSGETLGVVVGNYSPEIEHLRGKPRIHFARGEHAWGVLEGIDHYDFLGPTPTLHEAQA